LFYDTKHDTVNRYGGWPYESGIRWPSNVWSFAAGSANMDWEQNPNASSKGLCADSPGPYAAAHAYSDKAFFSLGRSYDGDDSESPDNVISGLVVHDFAQGTWDNTPRLQIASHHVAHKLVPFSAPTLGWMGFWLS
jgi:hypothetical protein